jgi:hypothetical protein
MSNWGGKRKGAGSGGQREGAGRPRESFKFGLANSPWIVKRVSVTGPDSKPEIWRVHEITATSITFRRSDNSLVVFQREAVSIDGNEDIFDGDEE